MNPRKVQFRVWFYSLWAAVVVVGLLVIGFLEAGIWSLLNEPSTPAVVAGIFVQFLVLVGAVNALIALWVHLHERKEKKNAKGKWRGANPNNPPQSDTDSLHED